MRGCPPTPGTPALNARDCSRSASVRGGYIDHGPTGSNHERPGSREALAACREGDTLVVTRRDRLVRSLPDARAIAEEFTVRQVRLSLRGWVYDPHDPVGRLLSTALRLRSRSLAAPALHLAANGLGVLAAAVAARAS